MNCEDYQRHVSQLVDNEFSWRDSSFLFAHLAACDDCRMFFESSMCLRVTLNEDMTMLSLEQLGEKVQGNASVRIRREPDRSIASNSFLKRRLSLSVSAVALIELALVVIVIGVSSLWNQRQNAQTITETRQVQMVALPIVEVKGYSYQP